MQLTPDILDEFRVITGMDIANYFQNALTFLNGDYLTIVNYYSGYTNSISSTPFENFDRLKKQNQQVFEVWKEHSNRFNNLKWFLLIEQIEEIDNRLKTLDNINKWSRSSLTKVAYDPSYQLDYILGQNQTLENVAQQVTGSSNSQDEWIDIALNNVLKEEDYTNEGGNDLKISFKRSNRNFNVTSVVDVISGKSIYGKDIYRKVQFENNDLKCLDYDATILQAANILANLRKNDNPDNPNSGLQSNIVAGGNKAIMNFPVIIRQMTQTFAGDDTLKNFTVNNIAIEQDNLQLDYIVSSRLNEVIANGEFK
jgi:hypothetical protein